MNHQFCKCHHKDLPVLQVLALQTFTDTYGHMNTPENFKAYVDNAFNETQMKKELEDEQSAFYFLSSNTLPVGYIKVNEGTAMTDIMPDDHLELERIYLAKAYQGKGYGRSMIDFVKEIARAKGKSVIWLGVWQKNDKAIAFYERQGFVKSGTHDFVLGDDKQTDWVMKLNV